jgi:hypothetical protein
MVPGGKCLPRFLRSPNPTGAAVHSTVHTIANDARIERAILKTKTPDEAMEVLDALKKWFLSGGGGR